MKNNYKVFMGDRCMYDIGEKLKETTEEFKEKLKRKEDAVNHPSHYTSGKIEVIDFITDQKLDFALGNVVKYVARAGKKHESGMNDLEKMIQDLEKAQFYLRHKISILKRINNNDKEIEEQSSTDCN